MEQQDLACTTKSHAKLVTSFLVIYSTIVDTDFGSCLPPGSNSSRLVCGSVEAETTPEHYLHKAIAGLEVCSQLWSNSLGISE